MATFHSGSTQPHSTWCLLMVAPLQAWPVSSSRHPSINIRHQKDMVDYLQVHQRKKHPLSNGLIFTNIILLLPSNAQLNQWHVSELMHLYSTWTSNNSHLTSWPNQTPLQPYLVEGIGWRFFWWNAMLHQELSIRGLAMEHVVDPCFLPGKLTI